MRILVIGCAGSGKTTLARRLARELDVPLFSLDRYFWQPGWVESDKDEFDAKVIELAQARAWVMDGNYSRTLPLRLERADAVIWLDVPRTTCLARVLWRFVTNIGRVREDMGPGCPESLDWEFIDWVWNYRRTHWEQQLARLTDWLECEPARGWTEGRDGRRLWWGRRWPRDGAAGLMKQN
ncbi:AAA family ATPase [bacterium]|nr:AAA family ATPase [bacterium]